MLIKLTEIEKLIYYGYQRMNILDLNNKLEIKKCWKKIKLFVERYHGVSQILYF